MAHSRGKRRLRTLVRNGWISDQHGAWPMVILPAFVGAQLAHRGSIAATADTLAVIDPVLATSLPITWLTGFLCFTAIERWALTPKKRRPSCLPAIITWGTIATTTGLITVIRSPMLLLWTPVFLPLFVAALWEVLHRRPRSPLARLTTVTAASLMLPVFALGVVGAPSPLRTTPELWRATAILGSYFVGTVPFVRSMIRARSDHRWEHASVLWHLTSAVLILLATIWGAVSWPIGVLWVIIACRAWAFPRWQRAHGPVKPIIIGMLEIVLSIVLSALIILA
ncbi:YwiC-like family protein [Schaalia sp. ZJ405]|uniref:YwiC-like family protein n=1 Tax=Schaalia sp. ZJ405 TaxID=2709403 RepID=UPI0013EBB8EC|nr:YwiC-like family protein [Schaalia sp. ZJ405]QPK81193.1 YwiC-like family protein [Schaalia sp. ZJ405]